VLRGFWSWYEELTDSSRSQVISRLMNKLRAFLLRPFVRDAIADRHSTVDISSVLDGGICLVRIPKGSLVIDECHNFLDLPYPIEDMLAEARGFRVAMILAHQHLGQLPRELREGMSTNARSKIFFNASPEDARELARHTAPRLSDHDLANLGVCHAAVRLVLNGEESQPFTMLTQPLPRAIPGRAREIRDIARHASRSRAPAGVTPAAGQHASPPSPQRPATTSEQTRPAHGDRRGQPGVRTRSADLRRQQS
jgi:DNA helicase HerA-like ATPase